jgi:signal transduction histidine kinase
MIGTEERSASLPPRLPLSRLSFRHQITLLGTLVVVLFLSVLFATFATLRYTKSAVLSGEKSELLRYTENLAREYDDKANFSRQNNEPAPLIDSSAASSREVLALLTRVALQNADGVTAGFYSTPGDRLLGDAIPDHPISAGSNAATRASSEEQNAIFEVTRGAAARGAASGLVLSNDPGLVLIEAVPIHEGAVTIGAAWCLKRLPVLPGANRFRAYLTTVALGLAALASALLTLLVIRNLQGGVRKIEGSLHALERNLASQIDTTYDPEEIQSVVQAIHRLGATLKQNIERERQIESELRHAERLASLGRLVAGVAHEVRNPLATIRLRLQMVRRESDHPRLADSCAVALAEVERLNGMVNRLLTFARPVQLHLEQTDVRRLLEERVECFREQAGKQQVRIVADLPDGQKPLTVDKGQMAQVFDNIIQNAIEAMADTGGTLSVGVAPLGTSSNAAGVRIEFRDTGKGMSPAVASHIFDPFFTTKPSGTGLGLSICHELVAAHGGGIQVASEEGRGTTVWVTVPSSAAVPAATSA